MRLPWEDLAFLRRVIPHLAQGLRTALLLDNAETMRGSDGPEKRDATARSPRVHPVVLPVQDRGREQGAVRDRQGDPARVMAQFGDFSSAGQASNGQTEPLPENRSNIRDLVSNCHRSAGRRTVSSEGVRILHVDTLNGRNGCATMQVW